MSGCAPSVPENISLPILVESTNLNKEVKG